MTLVRYEDFNNIIKNLGVLNDMYTNKYVNGYIEGKNLIVNANVGTIRGLTATDGDYSLYLGIPYARVNESNPFGASIPVISLNGVFDAYQDSMACPQVVANNVFGNLDCLQLNVYVPNSVNSGNQVPVMIWIHGGGFTIGDAGRMVYGPKFLMRQNVILVTINYRLGPYGFMCLDAPEVPGNQGLKDQLLAFKWVKNNIDAFGGDISKITLFGESAGGHSIDLHLLSLHNTSNLFNNVIMQSGSSLASTVLFKPDKSAPIAMAAHLDFNTDSVSEALYFLANKDLNSVMNAATAINIMFRPCVEKDFSGIDNFITASWINASMPKVKGMSILTGFNNKERHGAYDNNIPGFFENLDVISELLNRTFIFDDDHLRKMEKIVGHFYLGDDGMSFETREALGMFDSDYTYIHPIQRSIAKYLTDSAEKVYYYMFSYDGGRNFAKYGINSTVVGALHADELGYLFDPRIMMEEPSPEDQIIIDRITTMWANFAKYSDPTPEPTDLLPVKWASVTNNEMPYLIIDSELSVQNRPYNERMAFWDLFYIANKESQQMFHDPKSNFATCLKAMTNLILSAFVVIYMLFI